MTSPVCQETHPDFCRDVTWKNLFWDLIGVPTIVEIGVLILFIPLNRYWTNNRYHPRVRAVRRVVGDEELTQVHYPKFLKACFAMEIGLSMWFAVAWGWRTYSREVSDAAIIIDRMFCLFFMMAYTMNAARQNFSVKFAGKLTSIITVMTVTPTFTRARGATSLWFSFGYLRASNAVVAVKKLQMMGAFKDFSDIRRMYVQLGLRTFALVACLVGTVFVLEILGDPDFMRDDTIETNMGGLSVIQLTYWIFTTISTVGYGDFAPKTVLSRLFIIVAIVVGAMFFTEEVSSITRVLDMESSGRGRFKKSTRKTDHVVLIGGGVKQFSSVMQSLMTELFSFDEERWPDLVIMASSHQPEQLKNAIKGKPIAIRNHIKYYMGDPTEPADMARIRIGDADLVIVIPSLLATDMNSEDEANILRALAVRSLHPKTNLRLMLLRSTNKKVAVQVGFSPSRCFSINEQKAGLFALACCCRGFATMITQFLMSDHTDEDRPTPKAQDEEELWAGEYREGRKFHLCGFEINSNYAGITFAQFAILATKRSITPIAIQINGKLQLAPEYTIEAGDVVFALVRRSEDITEFRNQDTGSNWREAFKERQSQAQGSERKVIMTRASPSIVDRSAGLRLRAQDLQISNINKSSSMVWNTENSKDSNPMKLSHFSTLNEIPVSTLKGIPAGHHTPSSSSVKFRAEKKDGDKSVDQQISELEAKALQIADAGGHYILVLLQGAPWQQVQIFLSTLRADHLPFHIPILVLIPAPLPHPEQIVQIFGQFPHTAFMRSLANGSVSIYDLRNCGMTQARCIALLAGNAGQAAASDRRMVDGAGVTLLSCIEGELKENGAPSVPVFLELHQQESVRFLSRYFENDFFSCQDTPYDPTESFTYHPRFANGNIFTASCFGATVARSYNMPGIVELMEAITLGPSNGQSSYPWQVTIPPGFGDRPYVDLVQSLLETHNAVCLGLFRLCFPNDSDLDGPRFVMCNPAHTTILSDTDYLFVLGSAMFGQYCFEQDLLPGASRAPSANAPEEVPNLPAGSVAFPLPPVEDWPEGPMDLGDSEAQLPHLRTPSRGRGKDGTDGMYIFHPFVKTPTGDQRTPLALVDQRTPLALAESMGSPLVPSSGPISEQCSVTSLPQ